MKAKYTVLAVLVGVVVGSLAIKGLQAQAPSGSRLPAFYIAKFEVIDREGLKPYSARVSSTLEPFGGRFIVRGGKIAPLEREAPKGIVVTRSRVWRRHRPGNDSPAYRQIRPIRHKAAKSRVFILEGTAN